MPLTRHLDVVNNFLCHPLKLTTCPGIDFAAGYILICFCALQQAYGDQLSAFQHAIHSASHLKIQKLGIISVSVCFTVKFNTPRCIALHVLEVDTKSVS